MFNEKFGPKASFTTDFKEFPFVNLSDVIKENGHKTLKVQAVYTFKPKKGDNAGKDVPVLVADGLNIYIPTYLLDTVMVIRSNPDMVEAINNGKCGFKTREWVDEKRGNKIRFTGDFIDIWLPVNHNKFKAG